MRLISAVLLLLMMVTLIYRCGSNNEAEGDQAYAGGKYDQAINYYLKAKKERPEDASIKGKIALSYMQKGLFLYRRTQNLEAFTGNFEKAKDFIPKENPTVHFDTTYSRLLYELARAYHEARPANEIQKEQYFNNKLKHLEKAIQIHAENQAARDFLQQIREDNFQRMYDKGLSLFKQARRERRNGDLFLSAEYYLRKAVDFDPQNVEARNYLKQVRNETISILDMDQILPIAVAAQKQMGGRRLLDLAVLNNSGETLVFDPNQLTIVDRRGNSHAFDPEETKRYEGGLTEARTLKAREQLNATIAVALPASAEADRLVYKIDDEETVVKYFP